VSFCKLDRSSSSGDEVGRLGGVCAALSRLSARGRAASPGRERCYVGIGLQPAQEAPGRPGAQSLSPIRDIVVRDRFN
jgi:hypothetical protein